MKEINLNDTVKLQLEGLSVEEVFENTFNNNGKEVTVANAHVKQERTVVYPARNMGTGFGDGLFDNPEGDKYSSTRHCLVAVPTGSTAEVIAERLATLEDSMIYRILSNDVMDVIGNKAKTSLEQGLTDLDTLKARHVVQNGDGDIYANYTKDGQEIPEDNRVVGKIIKDEDGKTTGMEITNDEALLEFKADVYSREYREDVDTRQFINKGTQEEVVEEAQAGEITA